MVAPMGGTEIVKKVRPYHMTVYYLTERIEATATIPVLWNISQCPLIFRAGVRAGLVKSPIHAVLLVLRPPSLPHKLFHIQPAVWPVPHTLAVHVRCCSVELLGVPVLHHVECILDVLVLLQCEDLHQVPSTSTTYWAELSIWSLSTRGDCTKVGWCHPAFFPIIEQASHTNMGGVYPLVWTCCCWVRTRHCANHQHCGQGAKS